MITVFGITFNTIPSTAIPLNASDCMCQSIQDITMSNDIPDGAVCVNNSQCTGLDCTFNIGGTMYKVETQIQPCSYPPGFIFIVSQVQTGTVVFEDFFDSSNNSSILFELPLYVVVIHKPYSMVITVSICYILVNSCLFS